MFTGYGAKSCRSEQHKDYSVNPLSGLVVVYIEDSAEMQQSVSFYLTKFCGMKVHIANTGLSGMELVNKVTPHLILLDAMLPDLNGLDVCRRLREEPRSAETPIIMLSIHDSPTFMHDAYEAGVTRYVNKSESMPLKVLEEAILDIFQDRPLVVPRVAVEDITETKTDEYGHTRIAQLYQKRPEQILPQLGNLPQQEWGRTIAAILKGDPGVERGYAVIALAAWQKLPHAPYNETAGQKFFWEYVRHSLASSTAHDAGERWGKLAMVAYALMYPPRQISRALQYFGINNPFAECRQWALRILIENRSPEAAELAARGLKDRNDEVRATAALALATLGSTQYVPLLTQALNDDVGGVREQAALALARIGGEIGAVALEVALLDGIPEAAESAANGLAIIGSPEAVDALIRAAEQRTEPVVLCQIVHALGKIKSNKCKVALWKLGKHDDEAVRKAALLYVGLR